MTATAPTDAGALREALVAVTPEMLKAAWGAWHARHGGRLGPGPAFTEALAAGLAARATTDADLAKARDRIAGLEAALGQIASHPKDYDDGVSSFSVGWAFSNVKNIARAAITHGGDRGEN